MFWLDGGGARSWSGRRSILGALGQHDISLTYSAATGEVVRHQNGRSDVVGDDPFTLLDAEVARDDGDRAVSWVGCFGYRSRSDLPAAVGSGPGAGGMRVRAPIVVAHAPRPGPPASAAAHGVEPPRAYAAAFAEGQR